MEVTQQINRTYYVYGYGKVVDYMLPQQSTTGGTITLVPPLGELELDYLQIINATTVTITVTISDGSTPIYSASINPSSALVIQEPQKLIFLQAFVLNTGGNQVYVYGSGKVFLPPTF